MSLESHRACLWVIELQIQPCNSLTTWQNSAKEQPQECGLCNQYLDSTFARDLNWRRLLSLDCRVDIHNKNTLRRLSVPPYGSPSGSMIWSKSGSMTTKQLTQKHYIDGLWIDYWLLWHLTLHTICLDGLGQNMAHRVLVTLALCSSVVMHSVGKSVGISAFNGRNQGNRIYFLMQWCLKALEAPVTNEVLGQEDCGNWTCPEGYQAKADASSLLCHLVWKRVESSRQLFAKSFIDLVVMEKHARTLSTEP